MLSGRFVERTTVNTKNREGFTLVELMVGIAISSVLLIGLFQLLSDLSMLQHKYSNVSHRSHRRAGLVRILDQDLSSIPSKKPDFVGRSREFFRTTVAYSPRRRLRLETRVHYFVRNGPDGPRLMRETKWIDLQDTFNEPTVLMNASTIRFRYRMVDNSVRRTTVGIKKPTAAILIQMDDASLSIPVSHPSRKSDEEEDQGTPLPGS